MALTTLDAHTALIIIDLQHGIVRLPVAPLSADDVIARAGELADAFHARHLPVVRVNVAGGAPGRNEMPRHDADLPADWADLVPQMQPEADDICVTKKTWGAFHQTDLHAQLQQCGVTQVVVCGIATSIGVESTAREAYALGYNVTLATDAMTCLDAHTHENSVTRIFPRLGETGSTAEVLALLAE